MSNFINFNIILNYSVFIISIWIFIISFVSGRKHILGTLLSLEGAILIMFGAFIISGMMWVRIFYYIILFLVFVACEGALALSLLVVSVRWWGEDQILALNTLYG